jgi:xanthine dehydrogenase small subunit
MDGQVSAATLGADAQQVTPRKRSTVRQPKGTADSRPLRLIVNGEPIEIRGVPAATTLLDWLREHAGLKGTKEGCAEGDCGACTVVVERLAGNGTVRREPINACISMIGQLDGVAIRTVEGLSPDGEPLHPVQAALAEGGGTQCGFCTPGFVMSAYAFAAGGEPREAGRIHDALAGNLCRCTGYRPIVDALLKMAPGPDPLERGRARLAAVLRAQPRRSGARFEHQGLWFHAPATFREALALRAKHLDAVVLAGGTDVGLRVSRQRETLPAIIHVGRIAALTAVKQDKRHIVFGASVTCASALDLLAAHYPGLHTYLTRFGSRQIRSMATLGGNIATASPIGDSLPILLALDAKIKVSSAKRGARTIDADKFFTGYRRTALAKDELIESIAIPKPSEDTVLFADKISKRRDQDISTLCGVFRLRVADGIIRDVRLAFGGMAPTPRRARKAEAALLGQRIEDDTFAAVGKHIADEFAPISDWRGSSEYRRAVAKNLLQRLYLRLTGPNLPLELDAL